MTPTDPIRAALERAARELELSAIALRQSDFETFAKRAQNEAHAARAALDMREQGGLGANDANGIQVQLQRQRLAGLRAVFNLDRQSALSADDIPPGPLSEHELREQWNQQADEFNQWDSLDSCEQLAWAQARAIQRDRNARPTPPAEGEVPAVPEGREPASVADHYSPIQEALNELEEYDQANPYHDCRDLIAAARVALARWRLSAAPPAPLVDLAAKLIAESQPISPEVAATLSPDVLWDLYEDSAQPATPLEVKGASDKELLQIAGHAACIDDIQESWEEMLPIELTATEILNICRAVLARCGHQPAPPAEGEVGELLAWLNDASDQATDAGWDGDATNLTRCRKVLQQHEAEINRLRAQQTPVPVSERLPGPEYCLPWPDKRDKTPWCWKGRFIPGFCGRFYAWEQGSAVWPTDYEGPYTHWLPAHALPMPQGEVK